jgi:hypothetical protein
MGTLSYYLIYLGRKAVTGRYSNNFAVIALHIIYFAMTIYQCAMAMGAFWILP